jgi:hypothetical protein
MLLVPYPRTHNYRIKETGFIYGRVYIALLVLPRYVYLLEVPYTCSHVYPAISSIIKTVIANHQQLSRKLAYVDDSLWERVGAAVNGDGRSQTYRDSGKSLL